MIKSKEKVSQKIVKLNSSSFQTPEKKEHSNLKRILDEVKILSQKKFNKNDKKEKEKSAKTFSQLNLKASHKNIKKSMVQNIAVLKINARENINHNKNKSSTFFKRQNFAKNPNSIFHDLFNFSIEKKNQ